MLISNLNRHFPLIARDCSRHVLNKLKGIHFSLDIRIILFIYQLGHADNSKEKHRERPQTRKKTSSESFFEIACTIFRYFMVFNVEVFTLKYYNIIKKS